MLCSRGKQVARSRNEYATRKDFEKIFTQDMASLHLLAFLLTGDQAMAERCFVAGLEDSIHGNPVFKEWAHSWSRRAIIKRAIKSVAPLRGEPAPANSQPHLQNLDPETDVLVAAVVRLGPLERFVFVLSVLEGYSVPECAVLLACTARDVIAARSEALRKVNIGRAEEASAPPNFAVAWRSLFSSSRAA